MLVQHCLICAAVHSPGAQNAFPSCGLHSEVNSDPIPAATWHTHRRFWWQCLQAASQNHACKSRCVKDPAALASRWVDSNPATHVCTVIKCSAWDRLRLHLQHLRQTSASDKQPPQEQQTHAAGQQHLPSCTHHPKQ